MKLDQLLQLNLSNKKTYIAEAKKKTDSEAKPKAEEPAKPKAKAEKPKADKKPAKPKTEKPAKSKADKKPKTSRAAEKTEPYTRKRKPAADTPAAKLKAQVDSKPDYSEPDLPTIDSGSLSEHKPLPDDPQQAIVVVQKQLEMKQGPEWDRLKRALAWALKPSLSSRLGSAARDVGSRLGAAAPKFATKGGMKSASELPGQAKSTLAGLKDKTKGGLRKLGLYGKTGWGDDFVADLADLLTEDPDVVNETRRTTASMLSRDMLGQHFQPGGYDDGLEDNDDGLEDNDDGLEDMGGDEDFLTPTASRSPLDDKIGEMGGGIDDLRQLIAKLQAKLQAKLDSAQ